MAEYIRIDKQEEKPIIIKIVEKMQKKIKRLNIIIFILCLDIVLLTYIVLRLGGVI